MLAPKENQFNITQTLFNVRSSGKTLQLILAITADQLVRKSVRM